MKRSYILFAILLVGTLTDASACPQSLSEMARKEAERRKLLEDQGIEGKVITVEDLTHRYPNGNISIFKLTGDRAVKNANSRGKGSVKPYRTKLNKLDRDIRVAEDRLRLLNLRVESERRSRANALQAGQIQRANSNQERLHWQILELLAKLKRLKNDRSETYQEGRRAGFLPGELENRGIVP